ncbi:MAG: beta-propeller domain-containing protein [Bacillota bacterium]|nr:beta-propeller domain-containing protein [Bacillota bacterium]
MNQDNLNELKKQFEDIEVPAEIDFAIEEGIKRGRNYKRHRFIKPASIAAAAVFICVIFVYGGISGNLFKSMNNKKSSTAECSLSSSNSIELPSVGSESNLKILLKDYVNNNNIRSGGAYLGIADDSIESNHSTSKGINGSVNSEKNSSNTNVQVQGVDEDDMVKTDGNYIYKINSYKSLSIVKAIPADKMEVLSTIKFDDDFNALGMFLNDNYIAVIGSCQNAVNSSMKSSSIISGDIISRYGQITRIIIYDIGDKKNIKKVKTLEFEGNYLSSRMISSKIYIITNKYLDCITDKNGDLSDSNIYYKDSSFGDKEINIDYKDIKYFSDDIEPNYIVVGSIDLKNVDEAAKVSAFLGSGNNIYSSNKNLYVAGTKASQDENDGFKSNTIIYKLSYEDGSVKCTAKGEVPGRILNQFSMDENNNYFRIATTEYSINNSARSDLHGGGTSQTIMNNNLYVLDNYMNIKGKIENIAPGEQIYSVRFMGDRAYMVTYIQTDPLFVIDLKEPSNPKILGELKIPGFSNYLQPYDENHIIGIGKDSTVVKENDTDMAKPLGVKISMFDVTDVANPIQKFVTVIGDSGSYSEALNNHKAVLLSKEKNLLALPIDEANDSQKVDFQGAYIYNIDVEKGLTLKGKITHQDVDKTENGTSQNINYVNEGYRIKRILYINDYIYTISDSCIKSNDITTMKEEGYVLTK